MFVTIGIVTYKMKMVGAIDNDPLHFTENLYTVVVSYVFPGRRTTDGNFGWLIEAPMF